MKNKNKFSKWVWLLLIAAFVAIAGGGCGGSSSHNGGGEGNVRPIGDADHPLYDALKEHYVEMPNGTIFIGKNVTREELEAAADELRAAYEDEKIIGMYAPTQARIDDLHDVLGVDIFLKQTADEIDAAADLGTGLPEEEIEFYMIKQHDGLLFRNRQHYVGKGTPGAEFYQSGPFDISGDEAADDDDVVSVGADDDDAEPVEPLGDKSEAYPQIAAAIASWNGLVAEHAENVKAEGDSARDAIRAAAASDRLDALAMPIVNTAHFTFADQDQNSGQKVKDKNKKDNKDCRYKFPAIYMSATVYSCYSFQEDANYYMVVTNAGMNNEANYHHWLWRDHYSYDWEQNATRRYFSKPEMQFVSDPNNVMLLDHQPRAGRASYSASIRKNIDGSVALTGEVRGEGAAEQVSFGVADGVYLNWATTFKIEDYEVKDQTDGAKPWTEYIFDLPEKDRTPFSYNMLKSASDASLNFNSKEFWIWKVARSEDKAYSFRHNFSYDLLLMRYSRDASFFTNPYKSWKAGSSAGYNIDLPIPPTLALSEFQQIINSFGRTLEFSLFSDGDWELSCDGDWGSDADWVVIADSDRKGGKTQEKKISVTILENTSRYTDRKATITVTGMPDPNGKTQVAKLEIIQGHAR